VPDGGVFVGIMTTRGRAKPFRRTGNTRPVAVGGICTPSAAASVGATSCCAAGIEFTPVLTAGPANISGIETSYAHGEPCMKATSVIGMMRSTSGFRYAFQFARRSVNLSRPATIGTTP
jgi:hypothetical protein